MTRSATLAGFHRTSDIRAAAVILPGGAENSRGRYWKIVDFALRRLARVLAARGEPDGLAVYILRYRYRGWNGADADTAVDARWALAEIRSRHGDVPVVLIGNSLGGRAAFWVAGDPSVSAVAGLAPWLPDTDPVGQLAGRAILILHGDRDHTSASAAMSLAYAERARVVVPDLARLEVVGDNHYLLRRAGDCWAVLANFVTGTVGSRPLDLAITAAMAATAPEGLRSPLPVGFRRSQG